MVQDGWIRLGRHREEMIIIANGKSTRLGSVTEPELAVLKYGAVMVA